MLAELRAEREQLGEAILTLERLAVGRSKATNAVRCRPRSDWRQLDPGLQRGCAQSSAFGAHGRSHRIKIDRPDAAAVLTSRLSLLDRLN